MLVDQRRSRPGLHRVTVLGSFSVTAHGDPVPLEAEARRVVAYLAVHRRPQRRTALAADLWPGEPAAAAVALLAVLAAPAAHAEIAFDVIGGSEISFEGLVQADYNDFNNDFANLNGDAPDGSSADNELRRAELVLKGKGPGNVEWVTR